MNKTDFENGFALGFTSGGITSLDHLVTFKADGKDYRTMSIKDGNEINAVAPYRDGYIFSDWQCNGEVVEFPLIPTANIEFISNSRPLSDVIYEYYKVDRDVYPYVVIAYEYGKIFNDDGTFSHAFYNTRVFFTSQIIKTKSETHDNAYCMQLNTYVSQIEDGSAAHSDLLEHEINSVNIFKDIKDEVDYVSSNLRDKTIILTGGTILTGEFEDNCDTYWVTNDTTWANVKTAAKKVFIIA